MNIVYILIPIALIRDQRETLEHCWFHIFDQSIKLSDMKLTTFNCNIQLFLRKGNILFSKQNSQIPFRFISLFILLNIITVTGILYYIFKVYYMKGHTNKTCITFGMLSVYSHIFSWTINQTEGVQNIPTHSPTYSGWYSQFRSFKFYIWS